MLIPASEFAACALCRRTRREIIVSLPGRENGAFYLDKFCRHLEIHGIGLRDYCERYLGIEWPHCPVSGALVGYKASGQGLRLSTYKRWVGAANKERNAAFRKSCERASVARRGRGNPMFGRPPWNKDLPEDHPYRADTTARKSNLKARPETRKKMRLIRLKNPKKARHTTPHTQATKNKIRLRTAAMHARHVFKQTGSLPHQAVCLCLSALGVPFIAEFAVGPYCVDIKLPGKIALEVDGDFFHVNPIRYPDGPTCAIQRRNIGNDRAKNAFFRRRGWTLLRYWESEILAPNFIERLRAELIKIHVMQR